MKSGGRVARAHLLLGLFLMCAAAASGRGGGGDPTPLLPADGLRADLAVLRRAYEELHPGLYRYNSRARMDANFAALAAEFGRGLTVQQAYVALSTFLAKIKCGHSYPNFYNQPEAVAAALFKGPGRGRVPFYFRWIGRRMIVTRNFSADPNLAPGAEVLAINGVPAGKILARLMTVARADGSNDAKRVSYLEVRGEGEYEAFDVYFPMFFPQTSGRMDLRVKPPLAARATDVSVEALTYEGRLAQVRAEAAARRGGGGQIWEFKFLDERTAYLRMPTWAVYNSKWDWAGFLERAFDELERKRAANLVIDLRGNEGGSGVGDVILSRLSGRDLRLEQFRRLVRYRRVGADLLPYLETWDRSFKDWGEAAADFDGGFYMLKTSGEGGKVIKASARPFRGRAFVLVDASNSSATFEFAQAARRHKLATLVGQTTGGNQRGINGGAFFFLRLPNSKIEVDLPLIGFYPPAGRPDAGLRPDVPVEPDVRDIAGGVDTEMNALRGLLRARGRRPGDKDAAAGRGRAR